MVHNETSSGAIYTNGGEIAQLAHAHGALLMLDAISSLAGADLPTDAWDIDLAVSCNHKAIAAPIGHAYVAVSDRAWEVMEERKEPCRNIFGNLLHWKARPPTHHLMAELCAGRRGCLPLCTCSTPYMKR